jgi:hypothetical protein
MYALLLLFLMSMPVQVEPPVKFSFAAEAADDGTIMVHARATLDDGWYMYATELPREDGPLPTAFRLKPSPTYEVLDGVHEPEPKEGYDPNFAMVLRYHQKEAVFTRRLRPATAEALEVMGEVEYMCCTDRTCLPPVLVRFSLTVPAR